MHASIEQTDDRENKTTNSCVSEYNLGMQVSTVNSSLLASVPLYIRLVHRIGGRSPSNRLLLRIMAFRRRPKWIYGPSRAEVYDKCGIKEAKQGGSFVERLRACVVSSTQTRRCYVTLRYDSLLFLR